MFNTMKIVCRRPALLIATGIFFLTVPFFLLADTQGGGGSCGTANDKDCDGDTTDEIVTPDGVVVRDADNWDPDDNDPNIDHNDIVHPKPRPN